VIEMVNPQVLIGVVDTYGAKGFGFLHIESATAEVANTRTERYFFHIADVLGHAELRTGDRVQFQALKSAKGLRAIQVNPLKSGEVTR
jgi:cold shock CspA family protein